MGKGCRQPSMLFFFLFYLFGGAGLADQWVCPPVSRGPHKPPQIPAAASLLQFFGDLLDLFVPQSPGLSKRDVET